MAKRKELGFLTLKTNRQWYFYWAFLLSAAYPELNVNFQASNQTAPPVLWGLLNALDPELWLVL
jgi:hypothetical protein